MSGSRPEGGPDDDGAARAAVADAHRREWAFVLAATVRVTRDLDLAEECAQEAFAQALTAWADAGTPAKPGAWLTTVARRRALDVVRREAAFRRTFSLLIEDQTTDGSEVDVDDLRDCRLRLICTCC